MIYPYFCVKCDLEFDVVKSMSEFSRQEVCYKCNSVAEKLIGRVNLSRVNDWTESFNPAFGCIVKNKAHQREILAKFKDQGREFEEVGNEPVENIHKHFDRQREEKREERWKESTEKVMQEALK